ncbi:MAG: phosphomannomutase/phosphoglucomutase [Actinomycetota bacterium]
MADLERIFKAYDVRGIVPDQLNSDIARDIGRAFAVFTGAPAIAVGYDMRVSSPELAGAFMEGVTIQGADAVDLGMVSTDLLYFASGHLDMPGAMLTASHNPPEWNGLKLCGPAAQPLSEDTGLGEIKALATARAFPAAAARGVVGRRDLLDTYAEHVLSFIDTSTLSRLERPLVVAVDAGNGMAGAVVPRVFADLPVRLVPLFFELDGSFPNHPANPIEPENLKDLQKAVLEEKADLGLAFDGDADRCFVVNEKAEPVASGLITALVAQRMLARHPGAKIIHNLIVSRVVPEVIRENGGEPIRTRVGHSFIKAVMAETGAVFGGEHSGHYYFRDNYCADSGLIAAVHILEALAEAACPLSEVLRPFERYSDSGEVNVRVPDQRVATDFVEKHYPGISVDRMDGLTMDSGRWWFNLRPSNTEPLLRLNVEGGDEAEMTRVRDEVLGLLREAGGTPA